MKKKRLVGHGVFPLTSSPACWRTAKSAVLVWTLIPRVQPRPPTATDMITDTCGVVTTKRPGCLMVVVVVVVVLASDHCPRMATTTDAEHDCGQCRWADAEKARKQNTETLKDGGGVEDDGGH